MNQRILIIAIAAAISMFVLSGCNTRSDTTDYTNIYDETQMIELQEEQDALVPVFADDQFERITMIDGTGVYDSNKFILFRDKFTDVVYIQRNQLNFTTMLKPDGKPMLYAEWLRLYNGENIEEVILEETESTEAVVEETTPEETNIENTEPTYSNDYTIDLDEWE